MAIVPLRILEIEKLSEIKFHENKKIEDNSKFKLIPKPITLYEKHEWLSSIKFEKDKKKNKKLI